MACPWEAGQRVHPNLSRYTVASIVRTFQLKNRYIFKFLLQTVPTVCVAWFCIILHYYCTNCTIQKWVVLWSICKGTLLWCYSTVYSLKVQYEKKNLTNDTLWCNFLQNGVPSVPSGVPQSGRERLFTQLQGLAIIEMVRENNAIRLCELQQRIIANRNAFNNINMVSISTLSCILQKHTFRMKQLYRVPFERNSVKVKDLCHDFVHLWVTLLYILYIEMWDWGFMLPPALPVACSFLSTLTHPSPYLCENIDIRVTVCVFSNTVQYFLLKTFLDFDAGELPREFIYVDEAGFNLANTRRRSWTKGCCKCPWAAWRKYHLVCCN